jgi:hypothetical protein
MSATLTTNIFNPPSSLITDVVRHIHIVNKTAGAVTFTLYLGATGGNASGTEIVGIGRSVAANSAFDWYGELAMQSTDFIVGGASAANSLTITITGERVAN